MFKFFRKIRHDLVTQRKFRTYLTYAVGEIVLVVAGILIALSINNRKEANALKKMELQLYGDMQTELSEDLKDMQGNKAYNKRFLILYKAARQLILTDTKREHIDSLAAIAAQVTRFSDFKNDQPIYDRLFTSGEHDLVTDKDVLMKLKKLASLYNYINRLETNQQDFMYSVLPKVADYIRVNPPQIKDPDALYGYRFHNDIEVFISIMEEKNDLYEQAEEQLNSLLTELRTKL